MKPIFSILIATGLLSACTNHAKEEALIKQQAIIAVRDSIKLDSFKRVEVQKKEDARVAAQVKVEKEAALKAEKRTLLLSERNEAASANSAAATPAKKKGWSSAAKGAVIGAGAGALGGVLVDKNNARGAIIGGVAGAGAGYLIGRGQDRKSGRVQPKN